VSLTEGSFILDHPTANSSSSRLDPSLGLLTIPILSGLVIIRQSGQMLKQVSQFSESLLQGEQLPILEKSSSHNVSEAEALPYENGVSTDSET
jgi:hypothetical protein